MGEPSIVSRSSNPRVGGTVGMPMQPGTQVVVRERFDWMPRNVGAVGMEVQSQMIYLLMVTVIHLYRVFEYEMNLLFIILLYLYPMLDLEHGISCLNLNALLFSKVDFTYICCIYLHICFISRN